MYRTTQNELCRQTLEQKNPGLQSIKIAHEKKKTNTNLDQGSVSKNGEVQCRAYLTGFQMLGSRNTAVKSWTLTLQPLYLMAETDFK